MLVKVSGTPLEQAKPLDGLEFVRVVAAARILMPKSVVRLSAGREQMTDELHALCFLAGASSIFYGTKLLTTKNAEQRRDDELFERLGISATENQTAGTDEEDLKIIFRKIHEGAHNDQEEHHGCFRLE